jgi:hypothetical protein
MQAIGTPTASGFWQPVSHAELNNTRLTVYDEPEVWAVFSQHVDKLSQPQVFQSFVVVCPSNWPALANSNQVAKCTAMVWYSNVRSGWRGF